VIEDQSSGITDDMVSIYTDDDGTQYKAFYCFDVPFSFGTALATDAVALVFGSNGGIDTASERLPHIFIGSAPGCPGGDLLVEMTDFDGDSEPGNFRIVFF
jgi:hypothetical protein